MILALGHENGGPFSDKGGLAGALLPAAQESGVVVSEQIGVDPPLEVELQARDMRNGDAGALALSRVLFADKETKCSCSLSSLALDANRIGDKGLTAFASAIASGSLPALEKVVVQHGHENHTKLVAACEPRGVVIE